MSSSSPTRLGRLTYKVGEYLVDAAKEPAAKKGAKASPRAMVAQIRQRVLEHEDGRDLPQATIDTLMLNALRMQTNRSQGDRLDDAQVLKLLEAIFGTRMPAKLGDLAPALEKAAAVAERVTQEEIKALTRGRPARATSVSGLEKELVGVAKLALLGEWPESSKSWLERAMRAGVGFDLLDRYHDLQRRYWEVTLETVPPKLEAMAAKGKWDSDLEAKYAEAAFHLSKGRFTLSNARGILERAGQKPPPAPATKSGTAPTPSLDHSAVRLAPDRSELLAEVSDKGDRLMSQFLGQIEAEANRALSKGETADFGQAVQKALDRRWSKIVAAVEAGFPKTVKGVDLRAAHREQRERLSDKATWQQRMIELAPDLRLGETFAGELAPSSVVYSGADEYARKERQELIESLVQVAPPAGRADEALLSKALDALDIQMLRELRSAGYTICVARHLVSNAEQDLTPLVGYADGLHRHDGPRPRITVRSYLRDGGLQLDASTLLHEIGHAYDLRIKGSMQRPLHLDDRLVEAFKVEHQALPSYFHEQGEFVAEALARYHADPERTAGLLPLTKRALDQLGMDRLSPDVAALAKLQASQVAEAAVNVSPEPYEILRKHERINRLRAQGNVPLEPMVLELDGSKDQGVEILAASLAHTLRMERSPDTLPFRNGEALVPVSAEVFNDRGKLQSTLRETLTDRRGTFLLLNELSKIPDGSPGFKIIAEHFERFGGIAHLMLQGSRTELDRFQALLPTAARARCTLDALTPAQVVENVVRRARAEGFELSAEAMSVFAARAGSGGLSRANDLWKNIKLTHAARMTEQMALVERDPKAAVRILARDVRDAPIPETKDPLKELEDKVGLGSAKTVINQILGHLKLGTDPSQRPRLNLLFSGNPGTGKTTVAELFTEILHERGALKRKKVAMPLLQDVVDGNPEANVKRLFEENKGGVIFFDEFHQLKDTEAGRRAFKAMIPYLGNAAFKDTVFIGAGYDEELKEMIRELDKGGERRFQNVPFDDYKPEELAKICDLMARSKHLELSPEARTAALGRIERERRCMMNFGNAGTVETVLNGAMNKCIERVAKLEGAGAKELIRLRPEDFAPDAVVSKEEVWKEIDALRGNEGLKKQLKSIGNAIDVARYLGEDPLASFEPYIVVAGPRGSGKSTLAHILARFFAAYDIVPTSKLVERAGPDLQGKFVGQTASEVKSLFRSAWGGTLFIDEVSGLAKAGGTFKDEVAKTMLPILENNRGRFIMVVADYPENINLFFNMDAGLESRFGLRLETEGMSGANAADGIVQWLEQNNRSVDARLRPTLEAYAARLAALPNFANGRDVRSVAGAIKNAHDAALGELLQTGKPPKDPRAILPVALETAFQEILSRKAAQNGAEPSRPTADEAQYATEVQARASARAKESPSRGGGKDEVLDALRAVNEAFADRFGNDPAALVAARADAGSDYARRLAEKLGVEPEEALRLAAETEKAIGKAVKVRSLKQRFEYHCPFCGGIDSKGCAYIDMPLDWKIANSLKKPWTETVEEVLGGRS